MTFGCAGANYRDRREYGGGGSSELDGRGSSLMGINAEVEDDGGFVASSSGVVSAVSGDV
jgi:hypothetical protein